MRLTIILALCVGLSACGAGRLLSYGGNLSDATLALGPAQFKIYVHPQDDTLLLQRSLAQSNNTDGAELMAIVARQFLEPTPCQFHSVAKIASGSWEASYECPPSYDLYAVAQSQREALRSGAPIQP